jgi:fructosamine-3-kinase
MVEKESNGLQALNKSGLFKIPDILQHGVVNDRQYLLLEWIDTGQSKSDFWMKFGELLAQFHLQEQSFYGWHEDNYIGSLVQHNGRHTTWEDFFISCRVMPQIKLLYDAGLYTSKDLTLANNFCKHVKDIFPGEKPCLLHGDLWSGNFMITNKGEPALIDPAVYCGHREMDIGMTKLFGGFDNLFYQSYNEVYPLGAGWKERLAFAQLYPLLVHAVLFGGHYVEQTRAIMAFKH